MFGLYCYFNFLKVCSSKEKSFQWFNKHISVCLEALRALMGEMRVAGISFSLCEQILNQVHAQCHSGILLESKKVELRLGAEKEVVREHCSFSQNKFQVF